MAIVLDKHNEIKTTYKNFIVSLCCLDNGLRCCLDTDLIFNESGIGDEITQRIQALKTAAELESYYDVDPNVDDYDNYENEGFERLFKDEEFAVDLDAEDDDER